MWTAPTHHTLLARIARLLFRLIVAMPSSIACSLCDRQVPKLTKHHLIPRTLHRYYRLKQGYTREQLNQTVPLCPACHKNLHVTLSAKELASLYNTVATIQQHPEICKFTEWVRTKRGNLKVSFRRPKR